MPTVTTKNAKLTAEETKVAKAVLFSVFQCMQPDENEGDNQKYIDGGRFLLCLTKEEMDVLRNLIISKL